MSATMVDPHFPQISKVLEQDFMRDALQNVFNGHRGQNRRRFQVEACEIGEKRYKPGKSFKVTYRLRLHDLDANVKAEQWLTARLCNLDGRPVLPDEDDTYSSTGVPSVSYLSELDMLLWAFPYDLKLRNLPNLLDNAKLPKYFADNPSILTLESSERLVAVSADVIHYLPEQSCMIRYRISIASSQESGSLKERVVYGKNYGDDSGFDTYDVMQQIARQTESCAKPLFYDANLAMLWQAEVPGEPFQWRDSLPEDRDAFRKVARCIAAFHQCEVRSERRYGACQIKAQLQAAIAMAEKRDRKLANKVQAGVSGLLNRYDQRGWDATHRNAPLHLDLKMGNVLMAQNGAHLIDLDCVSLGDPLADTGSFIANLYLNGLLSGAAMSRIDKAVRLFLDEYRIASGNEFDKSRLNWHIAAAFIHEVLRRSIRQQSTERLAHLDTYIELSDRFNGLSREEN